jgi:hypothetical protein
MASLTRKRGKWICKGFRSEGRERNGDVFHVLDDCVFRNDYEINNNRLALRKQRIGFNPTIGSPRTTTLRRIHPIHYPRGYNAVSPSKLLEKINQLKHISPRQSTLTRRSSPKRSSPRQSTKTRQRKTYSDIVITPQMNDPVWLYANYTGSIKDYDGNDVYVDMYSERRY